MIKYIIAFLLISTPVYAADSILPQIASTLHARGHKNWQVVAPKLKNHVIWQFRSGDFGTAKIFHTDRSEAEKITRSSMAATCIGKFGISSYKSIVSVDCKEDREWTNIIYLFKQLTAFKTIRISLSSANIHGRRPKPNKYRLTTIIQMISEYQDR